MNSLSFHRGAATTGIAFVLSLFLISVMMCSATYFLSPMGYHFIEGCNQISLSLSNITFDRGQEFMTTLVVLGIVMVFGAAYHLNVLPDKGEGVLFNNKRRPLSRAVLNPVLLSFKKGIIRNLSYN